MPARFILAAIILAAAFPALAQDAPLPPLTPEGEYLVMTQDDSTSTSDCIGNPVTPLCAVETVIACFERGNDDLCRIGQGLAQNPGIVPEMETYGFLLYRVVRREVVTDRRFPWPPKRDLSDRPGELSVQAGDIRIDTVDKSCSEFMETPKTCRSTWGNRRTYIVRQEGDRWSVIIWGDPEDQFGRPYGHELGPPVDD